MEERVLKINFEGLRNLVRNPSISVSARLLCVNLLLYAGLNGKSFPTRETLAKDMGLSSRQIGTLLKQLALRNAITWEKVGKYPPHNSYHFSPELYDYDTGGVNSTQKYPSQHIRSTTTQNTGSDVPTNIINKINQETITTEQGNPFNEDSQLEEGMFE